MTKKTNRLLSILSIVFVIMGLCALAGYLFVYYRGWDILSVWYLFPVVIVIILSLGSQYLLGRKEVRTKHVVFVFMVQLLLLSGIGLFFLKQDNAVTIIRSQSPSTNKKFLLKSNNGRDYYPQLVYRGLVTKTTEKLPYQVSEHYQVDWLSEEQAVFTYKSIDGDIQQHIATYGGDTSSYSYVLPELVGVWQSVDQKVTLTYESPKLGNQPTIKIDQGLKTEEYDSEETVQFGVTSLVLMSNDEAKWAVGLSPDNIYNELGELEKTSQTYLKVKEATLDETGEIITLYYQGER